MFHHFPLFQNKGNCPMPRKVLAQYRQLKQYLCEEGPCMATGRLAVPCTSGVAWRIFRSSWFRKRLQKIAGLPFLPGKLREKESLGPQNLHSIEFREYGAGSNMLWHSDEVLLDPPQLEFVYTLENTSYSATRWSKSHLHVLRDEIQEVWTAPNSGLLLQVRFSDFFLMFSGCTYIFIEPSFYHVCC